MALPTPLYGHLGPRGPFRDVYEPAEDTFLLLDALERDAGRLREAGYGRAALRGWLVVEPWERRGCGMGKGLRGWGSACRGSRRG